jgi:hypothetical protein
MKAYWRSGGTLTSALVEVSTQPHAPTILPRGKSPWYPLDRRLGGPQSRSGRGGEEKNSQPRRELNPRTPIVQPVALRYTDWAIMAHKPPSGAEVNKWSCTSTYPHVFMVWQLRSETPNILCMKLIWKCNDFHRGGSSYTYPFLKFELLGVVNI